MDSLPAHLSPRKSSAASDASGSQGLTFRGRNTPRGSNASAHDMEMSYSHGSASGHGGSAPGVGVPMPPGGMPSPSRYGGFGSDGGAGLGGSGGGSSLNPEYGGYQQQQHGAAIALEHGAATGYGVGYHQQHDQYSSSKDKGVRPAVRARSAAKSLLLGACVAGGFLGLMAVSGFFSSHRKGGAVSSSAGGAQSAAYTKGGIVAGPRRSLRGKAAVVLASSGQRIERGKVDHHHARVLLVPSLEPFTRRNIHHYAEHDAKGRLVPPGGHRNDSERHVHVDWMEDFVEERREYVRHPSDSLLKRDDRILPGDPGYDALEPFFTDAHLDAPFATTGETKHVHTIHGVDDAHAFDAHDYFGSSMANLGTDKRSGLTTLAVGAPGALDTAGVLYFLSVDKEGEIDSYTYLTHEDAASQGGDLSQFWGPNTALGWAVENIGDLDGDGNPDVAVGGLGFPDGTSKGAVFIFFLTADHEIKGSAVISEKHGGFNHVLNENARFGSSIARIGDLDGDGVPELAVGAMGAGKERGAVYILFMNKDGTVKKTSLIASLLGWDHKLTVQDQFGNAVRAIGDLDGDGIPELAVSGDGFPSGEGFGGVWILFLNKEGTVKKWRRLEEMDQLVEAESLLGASIDYLGDLDGDGKAELLIGAPGMHDLRGEAFIVSLDKDAKVRHVKPLVDDDHELYDLVHENDEFGWSVLSLGDLDGDGAPELAIAAETSPGYDNQPSIHMVFLQPQMGTTKYTASKKKKW